jgi:hypothetical protein
MPAFDPSNITFVLLWLRCGLPPTAVVMTWRHNVVMPHGITSQRRDVISLLIVLNMTSYNGFAAKFIKNAQKHWIKWIFRHNIAINGWFSRPIWIFDGLGKVISDEAHQTIHYLYSDAIRTSFSAREQNNFDIILIRLHTFVISHQNEQKKIVDPWLAWIGLEKISRKCSEISDVQCTLNCQLPPFTAHRHVMSFSRDFGGNESPLAINDTPPSWMRESIGHVGGINR